jgi:ribosomal protein S18 acetylase RimI-like enzyme
VSSPRVRLAGRNDRERVVDTVVAAFAEDPAFRHFFPEGEYADQAPIFVRHLFDQRTPHGGVWVADEGAAVALWNPPGVVPTWPPSAQSAAVVARMERYDCAVHQLLPADPSWYLGVLATHPDHAGQRLGRLVMAAGLERAQEDGLPAYLETVTPTNVAIYTASGWTIAGTTSVDELDVWVMRHG